MKITDILTEMPQIINKELPVFNLGTHKRFNTFDTLSIKYITIIDQPYYVGLSKDNSYAIIGEYNNRDYDNAKGVNIIGSIEFKTPLNISSTKLITNAKILQVDGVQVDKDYQRDGIGYYLYFALITAGYAIVSDNIQYLGGQAIWKKIAKLSNIYNYKVYIMDDMVIRTNNGVPVYYDSSNIDDCEIWSTQNNHIHTLLIAVK